MKKRCGVQESWEERAQQASITLCSVCLVNSLERGVVRSTTRCELKISSVSGTQTGEIEYIEWTDGLTKTRQGGLVKQDRRVPQKLFPSNTEHCPVNLFKLLISKRPADLCTHGPLTWHLSENHALVYGILCNLWVRVKSKPTWSRSW